MALSPDDQFWSNSASVGWLHPLVWLLSIYLPIGGSRGAHLVRAPLRVPILSFWHTKFSKCNRLGSPHPLLRGPRPPTGNPGSATAIYLSIYLLSIYLPIFCLSIYLFIYLSIFCLSDCLSIYLSIYCSFWVAVCDGRPWFCCPYMLPTVARDLAWSTVDWLGRRLGPNGKVVTVSKRNRDSNCDQHILPAERVDYVFELIKSRHAEPLANAGDCTSHQNTLWRQFQQI